MKRILRQATINDPRSSYHGSTLDLLLIDGRIEAMSSSLTDKDAVVIDCHDKTLSPGWFDIGVFSGAPGYEHREDRTSLQRAALAGGYTGVAVWPDTDPFIDQAMTARSIVERDPGRFQIVPLASPVRQGESNALSEIYDLERAGVGGFGLGVDTIDDIGLLRRILEYLKGGKGCYLWQNLRQPRLNPFGQISEGSSQVLLGVQGIPIQEEWIRVQRDIALAEYTQSKIVLHGLTSAQSIEYLQDARSGENSYTKVAGGVPVMNLCFGQEVLDSFESAYKVLPPLREESVQSQLRQSVLEGKVDYIYTNHHPLESELKNTPFGDAAYGAALIDIAFPLLNTAMGEQWSDEALVQMLSINPRELCGIPVEVIEPGGQVNMTLYDRTSAFDLKRTWSKSSNYPPVSQDCRGRVWACLVGRDYHAANH